jgi:hypothetical protein
LLVVVLSYAATMPPMDSPPTSAADRLREAASFNPVMFPGCQGPAKQQLKFFLVLREMSVIKANH